MIEYIGVLVYFLVATLLGVLMFWAATKCSPKRFDLEKVTAYECGYDAFGEARSPFDVGFYLVAILFLVFDIEVAYLIPWALGGVVSGWAGLTALLLFLAVLVIGFVYEWGKGALDWNSASNLIGKESLESLESLGSLFFAGFTLLDYR
jgi:NADH:ubiquinone oxidoreductase subunit 3 (subunit A)